MLRLNEVDCPSHKYEHMGTEILVKNGKKDGRYFTERGKCIHCGKELVWSNFVDKTHISIITDFETNKRIISIEDPAPIEEAPLPRTFYASVPQELKQSKNWVRWKLTETADGKLTKIPYQATSTDSATWKPFDVMCHFPPSEKSGIGFVFDGNGIVGIDLDHCLENGNINKKFLHIVEQLKTYAEISPSGTGLHLFIRCTEKPYPAGRKRDDVEIYSVSRYFTITGQQLEGSPNTIIEYPAEMVRKLLDPFLASPANQQPIKPKLSSIIPSLSDEDIIRILTHSANSYKFERLMQGSISEYNNDRSRADMALASILAFYSYDANQIERIMRQSGLSRDKWNTHKTYLLDMTIQKAIRSCNDHYEPSINGDCNHGAAVTAAFLSSKPSEQQTTKEKIKSIRAATKLGDTYPPLPKITHPLFRKWMDIGSRLMYSHPSYHFGNLLPIASIALGKRVSVLISTKYIYTNFYMMLVGTSTISGKSFSSDTSIEEFGIAVANIPTLLNPSDSSILKRKSWSNPRLVQDMSKSNNVLWYYDEAKEFFDESGDRGWNAPIIGNLCTAYDGSSLEISRSNKSNKRDEVDNKWVCEHPFLSLLFNMTISQLQEASTQKIVGSGFFYRWLWFLENGGEKKKNVTASKEDLKGIEEIKQELIRVGTILKRLQPNDICFCVNETIEEWSMNISKRSTDEKYQSATGRSVIHAYKIAMVFALFDPEFQKTVLNKSVYPIQCELPDRWVKEAISIVEYYLLPRVMAVIEYSEKIDKTNKQIHALNCLRDGFGGVATHSELLKRTKLDRIDFVKAINTLVESEEITTMKEGVKNIYCIKL